MSMESNNWAPICEGPLHITDRPTLTKQRSTHLIVELYGTRPRLKLKAMYNFYKPRFLFVHKETLTKCAVHKIFTLVCSCPFKKIVALHCGISTWTAEDLALTNAAIDA